MTDSPAPARLLIVDDEPHIRSALTRALSLSGYSAEGADSGPEALAMLERQGYDLMVLDMHLPGMDGLEVMRRAHQLSPGLLVIILTGHATLQSAIAAVKSKEVVDYLLKPASVHQVAAAVTAALKERAEQLERERLVRAIREAVDGLRQPDAPAASTTQAASSQERWLSAGGLRLDRQKRLVFWEGDSTRTAELTEGEAAVLACLMARPDQVVSWRELARAVWGREVQASEAQGPLRSHVFRLRQKVETNPDEPHLIRTVRGGGYILSLTQG